MQQEQNGKGGSKRILFQYSLYGVMLAVYMGKQEEEAGYVTYTTRNWEFETDIVVQQYTFQLQT